MTATTLIPLRVSNHKAFVWEVDHIATLRSTHHICGILTGTLPHVSQQNVFLGIPLVLMPEEVVLLVENELAVIVDDPSAHIDPTLNELSQWNSDRVRDINLQIAHSGTKEVAETRINHSMSDAALRKRKEREERHAKEKEQASTSSESQTLFLPPSPLVPLVSDAATPANNVPLHSVLVPASSTAFSWYSPSLATYTSLAAAQSAGIWSYPSTLQERAKCGVFKALWQKGYYMGGGIKFGGDYLVYPGDPLRYHSHFAASVISAPTARLRPMEIVAHGRLGTATKKAHLLCTWDDEKKEVDFLSIEWAGFG